MVRIHVGQLSIRACIRPFYRETQKNAKEHKRLDFGLKVATNTMRSIKVVKVAKPRTPWLVAVPASRTGSKRVRRYFRDREKALAYIISGKQQGFLSAEGQGTSPSSSKVTLGECAALWIARHEQLRMTFFQGATGAQPARRAPRSRRDQRCHPSRVRRVAEIARSFVAGDAAPISGASRDASSTFAVIFSKSFRATR